VGRSRRDDRGLLSLGGAPPRVGLGVSGANGSFITYRQLVTAPGAPACQHRPSIFALHAFAKTMGLRALAIIRLKCTFRHLVVSFQTRTTRFAKAAPAALARGERSKISITSGCVYRYQTGTPPPRFLVTHDAGHDASCDLGYGAKITSTAISVPGAKKTGMPWPGL
jgi:hypothetical protein